MQLPHQIGRRSLIQRLVLLALCCLPMLCPADTATTTQTLSANLLPIGKLSVPASVLLTTSGTTFLSFSGTAPTLYRARTTPAGGGAITVQATSDFSPAGGPSIPTGVLTYTCGGATLGTGCSGTQTVSTSAATPVVAIPASACTGASCGNSDPNSVQIILILLNDPAFKTGTYSAQLTFTVSAT